MACSDPADPTILHRRHLCCIDSQSLLKAIECRSPMPHRLRSLLNARPGPTTRPQGNPRYELADTEAKTATKPTSDSPRPITYAFARFLIRRTLTDPPAANLLDLSADPLCPLCKEEPHAIERWLRRYPRLDAMKQNIFEGPS